MVRAFLPSELWKKIEPVIVEMAPWAQTGRPRVPDRDVLGGILYALRTGIQWEFLPQEMGVRLWHDLLAPPEGPARAGMGSHPPGVAGGAAGGRKAGLVTRLAGCL